MLHNSAIVGVSPWWHKIPSRWQNIQWELMVSGYLYEAKQLSRYIYFHRWRDATRPHHAALQVRRTGQERRCSNKSPPFSKKTSQENCCDFDRMWHASSRPGILVVATERQATPNSLSTIAGHGINHSIGVDLSNALWALPRCSDSSSISLIHWMLGIWYFLSI